MIFDHEEASYRRLFYYGSLVGEQIMDKVVFKPIGIIRSGFKDIEGMPVGQEIQ
ncbi:MAG: hypothetical protein ACLPVO_19605 [Desulfomonilaceae bacterium]